MVVGTESLRAVGGDLRHQPPMKDDQRCVGRSITWPDEVAVATMELQAGVENVSAQFGAEELG
jgi:hypothetical protein